MVDKIIRDGKVAVLTGEYWGNKFFTKEVREQMLFDSDIINLILEFESKRGSSRTGKFWKDVYLVKIQNVAREKYWDKCTFYSEFSDTEYAYSLLEEDLNYMTIEWVDVGMTFMVDDRGCITVLKNEEWIVA